MNKQLIFFKAKTNEYGGSLLQGRRKTARTLHSRKPMHFVLKAKHAGLLYRNRKQLRTYLKKYAQKFGIKIYSESVQKNHWHLCLKITNRLLYRRFIRSLTGIIARTFGKGLWQLRPYSRIVSWGRDLSTVLDYILLNECEVAGLVPYAIRRRRRL